MVVKGDRGSAPPDPVTRIFYVENRLRIMYWASRSRSSPSSGDIRRLH